MAEQHYDLFFNGQILAGHSIDQVMQALKENLKLNDAYLDNLFSGSEIRLKKQVDKATAIKFQQAFKVSGAKLIVKLHIADPQTPMAKGSATRQSEQPQTTQPAAPANTDHQPDLKAPEHTPNWGIAEPGAILVEAKPNEPTSDLDLSHLSLAAPGELLTHPGFEPPAPIIDTSHLKLTSNEGDIETLKSEQTNVQVNVSHLSIE